jgi:hypothetical protein
MKLGLISGYSGRKMSIPIDAVRHAENLGYDSIWTAEAYGSDAVTPAAWILAQTSKIKAGTAIMQMPARTPAMAAMTAMSLAELSGGRFICGVGASGPQVVEGWHGVPYGKPVTRLKEYITIMKQIIARQGPATFEGEMYQLPYTGPGIHRPRQAAEEHPALRGRDPHLCSHHHPGRRRCRRGSGRRLLPRVDGSGAVPRVRRADPQGFREAPATARTLPGSTSRRSSPASWVTMSRSA